MNRRLHKELFVGQFMTWLLFYAMTLATFFYISEGYTKFETEQELERYVAWLSGQLAGFDARQQDANPWLRSHNLPSYQTFIFDSKRYLLAGSTEIPGIAGMYPEGFGRLESGKPWLVFRRDDGGRFVLTMQSLDITGWGHCTLLAIYHPLGGISMFARYGGQIAVISLLFLLLAVLRAATFARSIADPMSLLANLSRKAADGDYSSRIYFKKRDAVNEVADQVNRLIDHVSASSSELTEKQSSLEILLNTAPEGFCIVSRQGRILLANPRFFALTGAQHSGQLEFFWERVRILPLSEAVRTAFAEKRPVKLDLEHNDRSLKVDVLPIAQPDSVTIIVQDVSSIRQTEQAQKDLVHNVSHELKTPLTAIKGFVETLQDEVEDPQHQHYLEGIDRNANRLILLIGDLLSLARDEDISRFDFNPVDPRGLVETVLETYRDDCLRKGIELKAELPDDLPLFPADAGKMEQVLGNLVKNALQYTERGAITVRVHVDGNELVFDVADTGVGIPAHHLSRIFERFYVVDKSRAKRYGGTGLGLSIVKQIVQQHQGSVEVHSTVGQGTTFTLRLPVERSAS